MIAVGATVILTDRLVLPLLPQAIRVGGAFDFDDFGTQIAKQSAQLAPGDDDAEVDDTDARQ